MGRISLSDQDIEYINRLAATEVDHSLARKNPKAYEQQIQGVVDTVLNRVASKQFPNTVRGVANQRRQFSAISGPYNVKKGTGIYRGRVSNVPKSLASKKFRSIVGKHIDARRGGAPSSVGGGLHYANPNYSTKNNRGWISRLSGPRFGAGRRIHHHGTTRGFKPVEAILGVAKQAPPIDFASLPKRGPGVASKVLPSPAPALAYAGGTQQAPGLAAIEGAIRPNGPRNLAPRQPVGVPSRLPGASPSVPMARPEYNFRLDLNKSPLNTGPASLPRSRPALDMQAGVPLDGVAGYRDGLKQSYVDRAASTPAAVAGLPKANAYSDRLKQSYLGRVPSVDAPIAGLPKANGYMDRLKQSYAAPRGAPMTGPAVNMPAPITGLPSVKPVNGASVAAKAAAALPDAQNKKAPELMSTAPTESFKVNRANKQNKGGTWMDRTLGMGSGRNFRAGMMGGALLGVNPLVGGAIGLAAPHVMNTVAPKFKGFGSMFGDALDEGFHFDGGFAGPSGHNYAEGSAIGQGVAAMMNSGNAGDFWDYNSNVDNPMADMVFGNEQAAMQGKSTKSLGEKLSEDFGKLFG